MKHSEFMNEEMKIIYAEIDRLSELRKRAVDDEAWMMFAKCIRHLQHVIKEIADARLFDENGGLVDREITRDQERK